MLITSTPPIPLPPPPPPAAPPPTLSRALSTACGVLLGSPSASARRLARGTCARVGVCVRGRGSGGEGGGQVWQVGLCGGGQGTRWVPRVEPGQIADHVPTIHTPCPRWYPRSRAPTTTGALLPLFDTITVIATALFRIRYEEDSKKTASGTGGTYPVPAATLPPSVPPPPTAISQKVVMPSSSPMDERTSRMD